MSRKDNAGLPVVQGNRTSGSPFLKVGNLLAARCPVGHRGLKGSARLAVSPSGRRIRCGPVAADKVRKSLDTPFR